MKEQSRNDFLVETKGHCFFCLNQTESKYLKANREAKVASDTFPTKYHSLQCLSSYLELDMRKVFVEDEPVPENLLELVQKSNLKVELCEECLSANDKFFELYRKLEHIKMEVASLLKGVLSKLENSADAGRSGNFQKRIQLDESFGLGKAQVMEALRKEAMQKCSRKVNSVRPKVTIQNMSTRKLNKEKRKLNTAPSPSCHSINFDNADVRSPQSIPEAYSDHDIAEEDMKPGSFLNSAVPDEETYNDDSERYSPDIDGSFNSLEAESERNPVSSDLLIRIPRRKTLQTDVKMKKEDEVFQKKSNPNCYKDIPPPLKLVGREGNSDNGQFKMNPKTGKYKCQRCSKEYSWEKAVKTHFKISHLKEKYKCEYCEKEFSAKHNYEYHYQSIHVGVRYKCNECDRVFAHKASLLTHQKSAHLGARFKCEFCPKTFSQSGIRNIHMKRQCQHKKSTQ